MDTTKPTSATTARVLKALSVFGGVQVIAILCAVVRTKLAALWLGPFGVGLLTIYHSTLELLAQTTQLNLPQSSVRDLSINRDDPERGPQTVAVVRKLARTLGIGGGVLVALLSPLISYCSFGDTSHTWAFVVLGVAVFLLAVSNGELSVMRGYDRLKILARCSLWGAIGLIAVAVPLFYFFRLDGIVPVIVGGYVISAAAAFHFRLRDIPRVRISLREAWRKGRCMLSLGMYMTVSNFVTLLASYLFVIYLNRKFTEDAVGIYQAGYTLVNTYVGLIFTSISMEYYPRLSAVGRSFRRMEVVVSHEMKIALWVLMPVAVGFICCSDLVVKILYTSSFEAAIPFIVIGAAGVFFRAASWCVAFTILARGDGKVYVFTELSSAIAYLSLYIPLFHAFGYLGLGIAYVLWYAVYFAVVYGVYRWRYGLRLRPGIGGLLALAVLVGALTIAGYHTVGPWVTLAVLLPLTAWGAWKNLR